MPTLTYEKRERLSTAADVLGGILQQGHPRAHTWYTFVQETLKMTDFQDCLR